MKYLTAILLAFNLISCSDSTKTEDVIEVHSFEEDTVEETDILEISNYSFKSFPKVWWMLTIEGEDSTITNYWDSQEMKFEITAETDSTGFIDLTYAQDSDSGPLFDFKAELSEKSDYL